MKGFSSLSQNGFDAKKKKQYQKKYNAIGIKSFS